MRYHYVWLLWSLAFLAVWAGVYEQLTWRRSGVAEHAREGQERS